MCKEKGFLHMRTNIEIDDDLMVRAMEALGTPTKRATVEEALRRLIEANDRDAAVRERRRRAIEEAFGAVPDWNDGRFDEGADPNIW